MKKEKKVFCPNCGTEFSIYENVTETKQQTPTTQEQVSTTQKRLKILENSGIDVDDMFAIKQFSAKAYKNGVLLSGGEVITTILSKGTIPNRNLFRRWVMAQMFRLLSTNKCMSKQIRNYGYEYTWKMLIKEFEAQLRMAQNHDIELYNERALWFNKDVAFTMAINYINQLKGHIMRLRQRKCKGVLYVRVSGKNIFLSDLNKKIFIPLSMSAAKIKDSKTIGELLRNVHHFNSIRIRNNSLKQCNVWINAYKGAGGYYTLQNMIRFHNCLIFNNGHKLNKDDSLDFIRRQAKNYSNEGWRMIGVLKQCLKDNNIDVNQKIKEWRKK